jgi:hypothetical protein
MDLGYIGLDWTFEKRVARGDFCRVRLDRALATAEWSTLFPFATLRHLVAAKSDHSPIVLMNEAADENRRIGTGKLFRYEKMWEQHTQFFPMLEQIWSADGLCGTVQEMREKLERISKSLVDWAGGSLAM